MFTFRHNNILYNISKFLDRKRYRCFLDLDGQRTEAGGNIPTSLVVTVKMPDIVLVDQNTKSVLTVPGESQIEIAHTLRSDSYSHFVNDIKAYAVSVTPFEVGAQTRHISNENKPYTNSALRISN